jgi:hypothetical protein
LGFVVCARQGRNALVSPISRQGCAAWQGPQGRSILEITIGPPIRSCLNNPSVMPYQTIKLKLKALLQICRYKRTAKYCNLDQEAIRKGIQFNPHQQNHRLFTNLPISQCLPQPMPPSTLRTKHSTLRATSTSSAPR